ncbi:MAG: cytochrome C [Hyphomicrobiaceae bacterium]|nr:cytochrome C [Hyphomicrobiaceae bacterium]
MPRRSFVFAAATLLPLCATAQEQGSTERGLAYARKVCAECHLVADEAGLSPKPEVKTFKQIANTPGMSSIAIGVWMQSEHENMPHIVPEPGELNDVVAYIVSLKD